MKYVLTCDCGSTEFLYQNEGEFKCKECGTIYAEEDAGKYLLGDFEY
jgi:transcription initiation factor IIE alpha subunit